MLTCFLEGHCLGGVDYKHLERSRQSCALSYTETRVTIKSHTVQRARFLTIYIHPNNTFPCSKIEPGSPGSNDHDTRTHEQYATTRQ